jgi:hypothetical protein
MSKIGWMAMGIGCGMAVTAAALPAHKANLDYVRSATALRVMQEVGEPDVVFRISAEPADSRSVSLISGSATQLSRSDAGGLLTQKRTVFTFDGKTKSYCMEIEPGCLAIDHGPFSKSVSVAVAM